ncbi:hypothetical protein [Paraburkholderia phosphatilytica]|uniref:hypothetical protein n=1 Tax=Paraburkholderia phosphatilytica TaxID=2282883 RepID=UPI0013DF461F|nr:hypothetical protein [Paraburkholderia phosphatilytica]
MLTELVASVVDLLAAASVRPFAKRLLATPHLHGRRREAARPAAFGAMLRCDAVQ